MLIFVVVLDCILVRFSLLADMVAVFDFKLFLIKFCKIVLVVTYYLVICVSPWHNLWGVS